MTFDPSNCRMCGLSLDGPPAENCDNVVHYILEGGRNETSPEEEEGPQVFFSLDLLEDKEKMAKLAEFCKNYIPHYYVKDPDNPGKFKRA